MVPNGDGNNLSSIVGTYKIFSRANDYWKKCCGQEAFKIELAGTSNEVEYYQGLFSVRPHVDISEVRETDLIIIPSLNHNYEQAVKDNQPLIDWVKRQYQQGAEVASICTGAFLLASTGLLDGVSCSTHWSAADQLQSKFPAINVARDQLITDEKGIYTNGGAFSFLNLVIYLVEKYFDRRTAIFCSKVFQIEVDRQSQSAFIIFAGQRQHDDEIVKKAQDYIESNLQEKISFGQLSAELAVSRRNFDRRFVKATGNTPLEYSQRAKIELAKRGLETGSKTVNEVMYEAGYSDTKAFRELFRKITGLSPMDYKARYCRETV